MKVSTLKAHNRIQPFVTSIGIAGFMLASVPDVGAESATPVVQDTPDAVPDVVQPTVSGSTATMPIPPKPSSTAPVAVPVPTEETEPSEPRLPTPQPTTISTSSIPASTPVHRPTTNSSSAASSPSASGDPMPGQLNASASIPDADDLDFTCAPATVVADVGGEPVMVTCQLTGEESLGDRVVTLERIEIMLPSGWTASGGGTAAAGTLALPVHQAIGTNSEHDVRFSLTPDTCDATAGDVTVRSSLTHEGSAPYAGPATTLTVAADRPPEPTVVIDASALDFGESTWNGSTYPPVTGELAITISREAASTCSAATPSWAIRVGIDGLHRVDITDGIIDVGSITYLGSLSTSNAPTWVTPIGADSPLRVSGTTTIAFVDGEAGDGGTWTAVFELDPPDDAAPGRYMGTIDVEIVKAPQVLPYPAVAPPQAATASRFASDCGPDRNRQ